MRKLPFTPDEFKTIYSKVPRLCVDLVITSPKGILLTLRQKNGWAGQWHLPGGTVYYKEDVLDTVNRIASEELGVKININKFLTYLQYPSEEKERGFGYSISLVFLCNLAGDNAIALDEQTEKHGFFQVPPENTILEQKELLNNYSQSIKQTHGTW